MTPRRDSEGSAPGLGASVLLPRMPAGLDLLSGVGSYEAVARVARAMGRAACSQAGSCQKHPAAIDPLHILIDNP